MRKFAIGLLSLFHGGQQRTGQSGRHRARKEGHEGDPGLPPRPCRNVGVKSAGCPDPKGWRWWRSTWRTWTPCIASARACAGRSGRHRAHEHRLMSRKARTTPEGYDVMYTVHFLAKRVMIDRWLADGVVRPARRRGSYSSRRKAHRSSRAIDFDRLGAYTPYGIRESRRHYGLSELVLRTFSTELSRRPNRGEGVEVVVQRCVRAGWPPGSPGARGGG